MVQANKTSVPLAIIKPWIAQLAEALAFAHERGVRHNDVKDVSFLLPLERLHEASNAGRYACFLAT